VSPGVPPVGLDQRSFRDLAGRFVTGVVVVSTDGAGDPSAMTANSFTSVCLEPPTVLVCLHYESRTALGIASSGRFAVSVLRDGQEEVANAFARRGVPRFFGGSGSFDQDGIPLVGGAIAYFGCRFAGSRRTGDHEVIFGEVEWARGAAGRPLVFSRGRYDELAGRLRDADWCWYS